MKFAPLKSFLMHLAGPAPAASIAIRLGGSELKWVEEFRYLGDDQGEEGPHCESPHRSHKAVGRFHAPTPCDGSSATCALHAQLLLFTTDILAGPLYPAAVQDIDYRAIDVFVNKRVREITGCPRHTSATLLRCELGILPSEFAAHRRQLQLWYHIHFEAWFGGDLGLLVGTGPYTRLKKIAIMYGLPTLDDGPVSTWTFVDGKGMKEQYDKVSWRKQVYEGVISAAIDDLAEAARIRQYDVPEGTTGFSKSAGTMQILPRRYVTLGGNLAKYGLQYQQALLQGQCPSWKIKAGKTIGKCKYCEAPSGDLIHVLQACSRVPEKFRLLRIDTLKVISHDVMEAFHGLKMLDWKGVDEKSMRRVLGMIRKACQLVSDEEVVQGL